MAIHGDSSEIKSWRGAWRQEWDLWRLEIYPAWKKRNRRVMRALALAYAQERQWTRATDPISRECSDPAEEAAWKDL